MTASETLGAIGIIVAILALGLAGFVYSQIPDNQTTDLSGIENRINANTANIVGVTASIATLDNNDRSLSVMIQDINNERNRFRFDIDDDDLDDLEDDLNDVERALRCIEDLDSNDTIQDISDCIEDESI